MFIQHRDLHSINKGHSATKLNEGKTPELPNDSLSQYITHTA